MTPDVGGAGCWLTHGPLYDCLDDVVLADGPSAVHHPHWLLGRLIPLWHSTAKGALTSNNIASIARRAGLCLEGGLGHRFGQGGLTSSLSCSGERTCTLVVSFDVGHLLGVHSHLLQVPAVLAVGDLCLLCTLVTLGSRL